MRVFAAALILCIYALLCLWSWYTHRRTHRRIRAREHPLGADSWLIGYASQTGTAESIAIKTANQLQQAGEDVLLLPLNRIDRTRLQHCRRALFIVSTYGEGEAPDNGNRFLHRIADLDLSNLQCGVLALGDRHYRHFCGFGRNLQQALEARGAAPLFDMIEVDQTEPSTLREWQYYLGEVTHRRLSFDWSKPPYQDWILTERRCLNPGSPGAAAFYLRLEPASDGIDPELWQAGDIAEVGPGNSDDRIEKFLTALERDGQDLVQDNGEPLPLLSALRYRNLPMEADVQAGLVQLDNQALLDALPELPLREYSIASTPAQGALELLVRQIREGEALGLGSGWLTEHAQLNGPVRLRIRSNPNFHAPPPDTPMILIGNGTGMAGLRAHLLSRSESTASRNWLLFGERTRAADFFFEDDIRRCQQDGALARLDLAFSRDKNSGARYVQDLLPQAAEELRRWVDDGASVYVCGSIHGMAEGVNDMLVSILGADRLELLARDGRYCRDVY